MSPTRSLRDQTCGVRREVERPPRGAMTLSYAHRTNRGSNPQAHPSRIGWADHRAPRGGLPNLFILRKPDANLSQISAGICSSANGDEFELERQRFAGQWVIGIKCDRGVIEFRHRQHHGLFALAAGLELNADVDFNMVWQL